MLNYQRVIPSKLESSWIIPAWKHGTASTNNNWSHSHLSCWNSSKPSQTKVSETIQNMGLIKTIQNYHPKKTAWSLTTSCPIFRALLGPSWDLTFHPSSALSCAPRFPFHGIRWPRNQHHGWRARGSRRAPRCRGGPLRPLGPRRCPGRRRRGRRRGGRGVPGVWARVPRFRGRRRGQMWCLGCVGKTGAIAPSISQTHRIHGAAIYGNIYHQYTPNVSIYTIHVSYGKQSGTCNLQCFQTDSSVGNKTVFADGWACRTIRNLINQGFARAWRQQSNPVLIQASSFRGYRRWDPDPPTSIVCTVHPIIFWFHQLPSGKLT